MVKRKIILKGAKAKITKAQKKLAKRFSKAIKSGKSSGGLVAEAKKGKFVI